MKSTVETILIVIITAKIAMESLATASTGATYGSVLQVDPLGM